MFKQLGGFILNKLCLKFWRNTWNKMCLRIRCVPLLAVAVISVFPTSLRMLMTMCTPTSRAYIMSTLVCKPWDVLYLQAVPDQASAFSKGPIKTSLLTSLIVVATRNDRTMTGIIWDNSLVSFVKNTISVLTGETHNLW